MRTGNVVGLCISFRAGIPKYPVTMARLDKHGFYGDYHNRPTRKDFKNPKGPWIPNIDRHITMVAEEALEEVNRELGLRLRTGSLAENILVKGFGNLSDVEKGSMIVIGEYIQLEVVKQNKPCPNTAPLHPLFNATIYNETKKLYRRGLLCKILSGVDQMIFLGSDISILPPSAS